MQRITRGFRIRSHYYSVTAHAERGDLTKKFSLRWVSNVSRCGHSVAAVAPKDSKAKRFGKKVPKDERRAMVESYVIKYKTMNDGKLPSISDTKKHVGGGYYIIRNIFQEMQHRSRAPSIDTIHETTVKKEAADVKSADLTEVSASNQIINQVSCSIQDSDNVETKDESGSNIKTQKHETELEPEILVVQPSTSSRIKNSMSSNIVEDGGSIEPKTSLQDDSSASIETQKHETDLEQEIVVNHLTEELELGVKERSTSGDLLPKKQQHELSPNSDKLPMGFIEKQIDKEELPKKTSMWGSFKSMADGIIKMWKGL